MLGSTVMVAIAAVYLLVAAGSTSWAQEGEQDACVASCRETKEQCVSSCGEHDNPMDCEASCQEEADDCIEQCG